MRRWYIAPVALVGLFLIVAGMALACGGDDDEDVAPVVQTVVVTREVLVPAPTVAPREVIKEVDPRFGGDLRIVTLASIPNLDPLFQGQFNTIYVASHMYESLFGADENLNPQPQMLKDWSISSDGLTYNFNLRDGLTFHDGAAVTTDDVIASFNRWLPASGGKLLNSVLDELVKVDDDSLQIKLTEPLGSLIDSLAWAGGFQPIIWPASVVGGLEAGEQGTPHVEALPEDGWIGTGAYKFDSWTKGDRANLSRYDGYVSRDERDNFLAGGKKAYLDTLVWLEIPDEETKIAGLETGQWDVVDWIAFDFFKRVSKNPDLGVVTLKPGNQSQLLFNSNVSPTDNKKVRQAIQATIDHGEVMGSLGDASLWQLCPAYFFCGTPLESNVAGELFNERNLDKARRLLKEAGYAGEKITILSAVDNAFTHPPGIVLDQTLKKIGLNVDFPSIDFATLAARLGTPEWNALVGFCANWFCGLPLLSSRIGGNKTFGIPGYPDLKTEFSVAEGLDEQLAVVAKMQTRLREDVWYIPLGQWFPIQGIRKDVKNLQPNFIPLYYNVWIEK